MNMTPIEKLFRKHSKKKVFILLNEGNRGDGLIHYSGRELLQKHSIDFEEIRYPQKASGEILFVYGCGAFCRNHDHMIRFTNHYKNKFNKIYILSATFDDGHRPTVDFLRYLPSNISLYCREKTSYSLAKRLVSKNIKVFLDQDLALYPSFNKWRKRKGKGRLYAFRKDPEGLGLYKKYLKENIDISKGLDTEETGLLDITSKFEEVHTDRAHVAIAAAKIGKKLYFYPDNYHKTKSIYDHSLKKFKNVIWVDVHDTERSSIFSNAKKSILTFIYNHITKSRLASWAKIKTIYAK